MATKRTIIPQIGEVTLYRRRSNRSIRLSITASGEIRVSMPHWVPYVAGERFAASKAEWITAHRAKHAVTLLQDGRQIGKAHRLRIEPAAAAVRITTRLRPNEVHVVHPTTLSAVHPSVQQAARSAGLRALRKEAEHLLPQRLDVLAQRTNLSYQSVAVKHLKSRWGSCSSNKEITLNIFLMQLPWHLIDYVLLHELTHTRVMRHGPPFWQELERHIPTAKQLRKEINDYQPSF